MGYKPSLTGLCLFYRDKPTRSFIVIDVDDGGIFCDEKTIQEVLFELGKSFKVKYLGKFKNIFGCKQRKRYNLETSTKFIQTS
jgi:hypothetical protein